MLDGVSNIHVVTFLGTLDNSFSGSLWDLGEMIDSNKRAGKSERTYPVLIWENDGNNLVFLVFGDCPHPVTFRIILGVRVRECLSDDK